jgi:4-alpha-glucanotransferase
MRLFFHINYFTEWGEHLEIELIDNTLQGSTERHRIPMSYSDDGEWAASYTTRGNSCKLYYRYHFERPGFSLPEAGEMRLISLRDSETEEIRIRDFWRPRHDINGILTSRPFTNVFAGKVKPNFRKPKPGKLLLSVAAPIVKDGYVVAVAGNQKQLGNWNHSKPLAMKAAPNGIWQTEIDLTKIEEPLQYKYCFYHKKNKHLEFWEVGNDRTIPNLSSLDDTQAFMLSDTPFRYGHNWKGTGVAIPVFSLRTENGFGVGEFNDLKPLADWCEKTGMKMIQILPVNETVASHSWLDSYPYKAISVIALHPMYLNIEKLGNFKNEEDKAEYEKLKKELNANESVDYVRMMKVKSKYYKYFFDLNKSKFLKTQKFKKFFNDNRDWLVPYAVFSCLRDRYQTADFRLWESHSEYSKKAVYAFADPLAQDYDDVAVHYYIQYHLHEQLKEAVDYAHSKGVALKGDIPIGISRNSVDAWTDPELFNLNGQAGAPPDDFAVAGQNWGFPTYKWDEMAKDSYAWWKKRLRKMAEYFDSYRIDHILGFFRIWEIPTESTQGLMGYFNPALPLTRQELHERGLDLDDERFLKPYIHQWYIGNVFGEYTNDVIDKFLEPTEWEVYRLKKEFDTQQKISEHFKRSFESEQLDEKWTRIRDGLLSLCTEVLFIRDPHSKTEAFHPRISLHYTYSYQALDDYRKEVLNQIYTDYFYHRHDEFWRERAMKQLPALVNATNMLVCGEDLGMVPASVPGVMNELGILSLEIQRMPKDPEKDFGHPSDYPYRSVASPSTHDMSTIRGWWEEDRAKTQRFFNTILGNYGAAPYFCEPWVAREIIIQHLFAPSLLAIFPMQDILALDGNIRWDKTQEERINVPSNPTHLWRYRMRQSIDELLNALSFNEELKEMLQSAGR